MNDHRDFPETPFLAVDLDLLEHNIDRMARTIIHEGRKTWRPHVKAIKSPAIAHKLIAAGAIGVTCAKLGEAEVMAASGIGEVLIASQIVSPGKMRRLAHLNRRAHVPVVVDDRGNVDQLEDVATAFEVTIPVLIELDIGLQRAGVAPGRDVVALAKIINRKKHVHFAGLMAWEGHTTRIPAAEDKERAIRESVARIVGSAEMCRDAGLPVEIVSCGGTGTYMITSRIDGVTELQAGGGVFGDIRYRDDYKVDHPCALTVWTTVISRPTPTRIVVDSGWKAMAQFPKQPLPVGLSDVREIKMSAEHTRIDLTTPTDDLKRGDWLQFIVGYSDSTVFLHDVLYAVRNGAVELALPLLARGKIQ